MDLWLYWLFLALSLICFGISLVFCARKFRKNRISVLDKDSVWMFVMLLLSGFFVMFVSTKDSDNILLNIADSFLLAIKLFHNGGGGDFRLEDPTLNVCYQVVYYFLTFYAPVTLVCTLLSFFGDLINKNKILRYAKSRNLLVFNELNERNLSIAKNFLTHAPEEKTNAYADLEFGNDYFDYARYCQLEKNKKVLVFCDVYNTNNEHSAELIALANEMGGIVLKEDILTLHKALRKSLKKNAANKLTRYFLSGADENENIRHAIEIVEQEEADPIKNLAVFTFAEGEANGRIIESLNKRKEFFVRRLSPSVMLAKDVLSDPDNYLVNADDPEKDLKVLILGLGSYGMELAKFLSWFYQRKNGNITLYIVDKDAGAKKALSGTYSDFFSYAPQEGKCQQDACFRLKFVEGVDVFSAEFAKVLEQIVLEDGQAGLDAVYATMGDDNLNIEASIHLRMLLDRIFQKDFAKINACVFDSDAAERVDCAAFTYADGVLTDKTKLFCVVHSDLIMSNVAATGGFETESNIRFVGADAAVYSCDNVFNAAEEQESVVKNRRGESVADKALIRYNSNEYTRRSAFSEVLFESFITALYPVEDTEEYAHLRQRIGNKRWNAYMRANGYTCFDVDEDLRAAIFDKRAQADLPIRQWRRGKWHNSIVDFDKLPIKEQQNNYRERAKTGSK